VYAIGIFSGTILVGSVLFTIGGLFLSDEGDDFYPETSILGFVLWGSLMLLAGGLWVWRRRKGRR
jgi:LPXTG-motif cell wall-anchored protein